MTMPQLLDCDADKLETFSPEQLRTWFEPYFAVTRPERARLNKPKSQQEPAPYQTPGKRRAIEALKQIEGFDFEQFNRKRKKK